MKRELGKLAQIDELQQLILVKEQSISELEGKLHLKDEEIHQLQRS